jgi:peptidoglycan/LPS O-acetylase OafA/YrhL
VAERTHVYRPEIDGLRAFAVLPVIFFHAGVPGFSGGFVGVDVFFVISGYLITRLLVSELEETGRVSILGFYERRARRLVPALFFMLAIVSVLAGFVLWPALLIEFGVNAAASAVFLSNVSLWLQGGYFGGPAKTNALLHTWSLAVEEQYYILVPPALWLAWWLGSHRAILALILISIVASLIVAELGTRYAATANYYLLLSRAWELMIGALVSVVWAKGQRVSAPLQDPLGWLGLLMIAGSVVFMTEDTPFPGISAIPSTLGTALLLVSAGPGTWIGRLLTLNVFVFFGLISYSLYLWHQPLLALYRVQAGEDANATGLAFMVIASVAMGWVSWRYVERPFRNRSSMTRAKVLWSTVACLSVVGATGVFIIASQGFVSRYPEHLRSMLAVSAAERGAYVRTRYNDKVRDQEFLGNLPRVLLIGDSFSQDFYNVIRESDAFSGYQISADYIASRCQFHPDATLPEGGIAPRDSRRCELYDNRVNDFTLSRARAADIVIISFDWRDRAARQLPQMLAGLKLRDETQVIVIGPKYFATPGMRSLETMTVQDLSDFRSPLDPATGAVKAIYSDASIEAQFVDVMDLVCEAQESCRVFTPAGEMISHDNRHLTQEGARYLGSLLFSSDGPLSQFGRN